MVPLLSSLNSTARLTLRHLRRTTSRLTKRSGRASASRFRFGSFTRLIVALTKPSLKALEIPHYPGIHMLPFHGYACFLQIIAFLFSSIYASDINPLAYFQAGLALFRRFYFIIFASFPFSFENAGLFTFPSLASDNNTIDVNKTSHTRPSMMTASHRRWGIGLLFIIFFYSTFLCAQHKTLCLLAGQI